MKGILKTLLVTFSLLLIITTKGVAATAAPSNVQLVGNSDGLVFIKGDESFLNGPNMVPGDKISRDMLIKNDYDAPYELFLRAERVNEKEQFDLLNKLELIVKYEDKVIYKGPTSGETDLTKNISLGIIQPGESKKLVGEVLLDGPTTGNEYKNKAAKVDWIFTAVRGVSADKTTAKIPKTYDESNLIYIVAALVSILLLMVISIRKKRRDA